MRRADGEAVCVGIDDAWDDLKLLVLLYRRGNGSLPWKGKADDWTVSYGKDEENRDSPQVLGLGLGRLGRPCGSHSSTGCVRGG